MRISDWSSDVCSSDLVGTDDAEVGVGDAEQILEIKALARHGFKAEHVRFGHRVQRSGNRLSDCQRRGRPQVEQAEARRSGPEIGTADGNFIGRSEEHTSELQSLMRISYAVFCLKKKKK